MTNPSFHQDTGVHQRDGYFAGVHKKNRVFFARAQSAHLLVESHSFVSAHRYEKISVTANKKGFSPIRSPTAGGGGGGGEL